MDHHLFHDLLNQIILLVDDLRLIVFVQNMRQVHRAFPGHFLISFQQLDGVPAGVGQPGIFMLQSLCNGVNAKFHHLVIDHGIVVVLMPLTMVMVGLSAMMAMVVMPLVLMDDGVVALAVCMVGSGVDQHLQPRPPPGGDRDHRGPQHLGQTVEVDLHPPLFHNVHHIEGHHHRLAQFQQLKGQIKAPLQSRGIHHVHNNIHLVREDEIPGHLFLHGIGGKGVGPRQVHQTHLHAVVLHDPLHPLHRDPGPVGHLQVGPGIGVKQGGLAAVGVADKGHRQLFSHLRPPRFSG